MAFDAETFLDEGVLWVTEEQYAIVQQAARRLRRLLGNPLIDEVETLTWIAQEYLREPPAPAPPRRVEAITPG